MVGLTIGCSSNLVWIHTVVFLYARYMYFSNFDWDDLNCLPISIRVSHFVCRSYLPTISYFFSYTAWCNFTSLYHKKLKIFYFFLTQKSNCWWIKTCLNIATSLLLHILSNEFFLNELLCSPDSLDMWSQELTVRQSRCMDLYFSSVEFDEWSMQLSAFETFETMETERTFAIWWRH